VTRHRLHRGDNRHASAALWRVVMTRMSNDPDTHADVERRDTQGRRREIIRAHKR
jgi:transposase